MREILFRGKRQDTGELVFGLPFYGLDMEIDGIEAGVSCKELYTIAPETLGQYTGLRDRNGKRIFEGDIVRHYNNGLDPGAFEVGAIRWNKNYANFERTSSPSAVRVHNLCRYEVIGNIYDNPEMMDGGADNG